MKLEKISLKHKEMIEDIKKEYDVLNEDYNGAFFIKEYTDYNKLINDLDNYSNGIINNPNYVPYTCYVLINDNKIIGVGSIRHYLNEYLENFGGHIGYSIVPSARLKGYGTKLLNLLLKEAKSKKIDKVLITCSETNIGSKKVIENNHGKLINKIENNNKLTCRYIISL